MPFLVQHAVDALLSWGFLRWFNVIGSSLVVALLIMGTMKRWSVMPARFRRMAPWVIATYVVIAYGSGEALYSHVQPGYRILLMAVVLLGFIVSIIYGFGDDDYHGASREHPFHEG